MDQKYIRNFAIIAHVDHGKSTLSDRFLEITNTIRKDILGKQEQFLDQNPISRERGITIKLAPVRMQYSFGGNTYMLNLIDTPGHVDFSYEVSRTLAACEGVILLVDATKGVQAQTVAHLRAAQKQNLVIVPAINKIDMDGAQIEKTLKQLEVLGFDPATILKISAKTGIGVETLLQTAIEKIPSPTGSLEKNLRALIFDAVFDEHRGVVAFVRLFDGKIKTNDAIELVQTANKTNAIDVGYFTPSLVSSGSLAAGEIGYIVTGVKDIRLVRVGDTIALNNFPVVALPGYTTPKPMVFFGVYPKSTDELVPLRDGLGKLALIDASLTFHEEYSSFLGSGFRVGFLGLLHADIFKQRLQREFNLDPLFTLPHVSYEKRENGSEVSYKEPYMHLSIFVPSDYIGGVMTVCQKRRGDMTHMEYQDTNVILEYDMPYAMFIRGLSADLKTVSSGFASLDYELTGFRDADLVEVGVQINEVPIDVLSELTYREEAEFMARQKAEKLKDNLPKQQYKQVIQCFIGSRVIARAEISPYRKDMLAKMSGGDVTRKNKLLEAQKKGKKKMFGISKVEVPQEALFEMMKGTD
ncbi:MAG TPA: translation elongation factor 4 [Candidatus Saccharimonadales bacterium]|nr:translation elongation factor 4 [Candidatus Saccharimonadales bacterium]